MVKDLIPSATIDGELISQSPEVSSTFNLGLLEGRQYIWLVHLYRASQVKSSILDSASDIPIVGNGLQNPNISSILKGAH